MFILSLPNCGPAVSFNVQGVTTDTADEDQSISEDDASGTNDDQAGEAENCSADLPMPQGNVVTVESVSELKDQIEAANQNAGGNPMDNLVITVDEINDLKTAVTESNKRTAAAPHVTIFVADGAYNIESSFIVITKGNITIRGESGNRDDVVIKGTGMGNGKTYQIFQIQAADTTIADMTIGNVATHVIQLMGEKSASRVHIKNVRFFDAGEQLFKGSYDSSKPDQLADSGLIECSLFEYTDGVGPSSYIGGIDVHYGKDWVVRDNVFRNIKNPKLQGQSCLEGAPCSSNPAEHAIHFWSDSENTIAERNTIINCDRGIGFGLGDRGHNGGIIRNNMIYHDNSTGDVGIGLESAVDVKVYNNTIFYNNNYTNAIEYRFTITTADIINNLTNKKIQKRDLATATLVSNYTAADPAWFVEVTQGNLRLNGPVSEIVDQGETLSDVTDDIDGNARSDGSHDIGASEYVE
ncbi:MAG: hypothetical protein HQM16_17250 [Deltaproteobacteria bacterium]|nr:hypothetical protein [Deltaproteobacteria bacterium]